MGSQHVLVEPLHKYDPARIGSYQLVGRLGAGAMGRVYLGRSAASRLVAVKTIKPEYAEEADFRARFAREVAAARRVSGVFTAAVIAADPEADVPWLATAYVPAPTLDQLVRRCGPLPVAAVRWLAAGCAEALESIHEAGLVHRDLKPSNVLVALDGPRVIDFGVARAAERIQLTSTRGALGTPAYIAPEQARDTRHATAASDVFSLGCTLLFAATGHAPYQGETVMDILVRLATEAPDLAGLPGELTDLVEGCLAREPERRPTSAALLAEIAEQVGGAADGVAAGGFGSGSLPRAAIELIEEYRRPPEPDAPRPAAPTRAAEPPGPADVEATLGSQLAGRWSLRLPRGGRPSAAAAGPGTGQSGPDRPGRQTRPDGRTGGDPSDVTGTARPRRRLLRARIGDHGPRGGAGEHGGHATGWRSGGVLSVIVSIGAVVALVSLGTVLGGWLNRAGSAAGDHGSGASTAAGAGSTSAAQVGQPGGGGGPPPEPPPPASGQYDRPGGTARIEVNQPVGDVNTVFVVHGRGWPVDRPVTVALNGKPTRLPAPKADLAGTFNYAVNQAHEFFASGLPPGRYHVSVQGSGGRRAEASFEVHP